MFAAMQCAQISEIPPFGLTHAPEQDTSITLFNNKLSEK